MVQNKFAWRSFLHERSTLPEVILEKAFKEAKEANDESTQCTIILREDAPASVLKAAKASRKLNLRGAWLGKKPTAVSEETFYPERVLALKTEKAQGAMLYALSLPGINPALLSTMAEIGTFLVALKAMLYNRNSSVVAVKALHNLDSKWPSLTPLQKQLFVDELSKVDLHFADCKDLKLNSLEFSVIIATKVDFSSIELKAFQDKLLQECFLNFDSIENDSYKEFLRESLSKVSTTFLNEILLSRKLSGFAPVALNIPLHIVSKEAAFAALCSLKGILSSLEADQLYAVKVWLINMQVSALYTLNSALVDEVVEIFFSSVFSRLSSRQVSVLASAEVAFLNQMVLLGYYKELEKQNVVNKRLTGIQQCLHTKDEKQAFALVLACVNNMNFTWNVKALSMNANLPLRAAKALVYYTGIVPDAITLPEHRLILTQVAWIRSRGGDILSTDELARNIDFLTSELKMYRSDTAFEDILPLRILKTALMSVLQGHYTESIVLKAIDRLLYALPADFLINSSAGIAPSLPGQAARLMEKHLKTSKQWETAEAFLGSFGGSVEEFFLLCDSLE